jgi:hypothetical protein
MKKLDDETVFEAVKSMLLNGGKRENGGSSEAIDPLRTPAFNRNALQRTNS